MVIWLLAACAQLNPRADLCLQGNCTDSTYPPSINSLDPPLLTTPRLGQCVIVSPFDLFFFQNDAAYEVWIDSLILRLSRQSPQRWHATLLRARF